MLSGRLPSFQLLGTGLLQRKHLHLPAGTPLRQPWGTTTSDLVQLPGTRAGFGKTAFEDSDIKLRKPWGQCVLCVPAEVENAWCVI